MTAMFDARSFEAFDGLRRRHFPPELNIVPAHATLFHHLAGDALEGIADAAAKACAGTAPRPFTIDRTRFLGRGVAFAIECPGLVALRAALAKAWQPDLTAQDRQPYHPHVTIQNKVAARTARETQAMLDGLLPIAGEIVGLALWHYRGGPWEDAGRFAFVG